MGISRRILAGIWGAFALTLAACAGSGVDEMDFSGKENPNAVKLRIAWWGGESRHAYTEELLERYTELHPNITFEAYPSEWSGYFDELSMQAAAGEMPDIVQMDYMYLSTFSKNGSLADLREFTEKGVIVTSDLDTELLESGKIQGKQTGIPGGSLTLAVGCNQKIFEEAGVELPDRDWTWEEFVETCLEITEQTGKYGLGIIPADDIMPFHYYIRQRGERLFLEDNQGLGYSDDQIFADFASMLKTLSDQNSMPDPDEYTAVQALGYERNLVAAGEAAMAIEWANFGSRLEEVNSDIALVLPPGAGDGEALWTKPSMFFGVADTSEEKEEAAKFIDWILHSKGANSVILAERGIPVSGEIREYLSDSEQLSDQQRAEFQYSGEAEEVCGEIPAPDPVGISEINEAFREEIYSVLYEQETPAQAAAAFRKKAEKILKENNT